MNLRTLMLAAASIGSLADLEKLLPPDGPRATAPRLYKSRTKGRFSYFGKRASYNFDPAPCKRQQERAAEWEAIRQAIKQRDQSRNVAL